MPSGMQRAGSSQALQYFMTVKYNGVNVNGASGDYNWQGAGSRNPFEAAWQHGQMGPGLRNHDAYAAVYDQAVLDAIPAKDMVILQAYFSTLARVGATYTGATSAEHAHTVGEVYRRILADLSSLGCGESFATVGHLLCFFMDVEWDGIINRDSLTAPGNAALRASREFKILGQVLSAYLGMFQHYLQQAPRRNSRKILRKPALQARAFAIKVKVGEMLLRPVGDRAQGVLPYTEHGACDRTALEDAVAMATLAAEYYDLRSDFLLSFRGYALSNTSAITQAIATMRTRMTAVVTNSLQDGRYGEPRTFEHGGGTIAVDLSLAYRFLILITSNATVGGSDRLYFHDGVRLNRALREIAPDMPLSTYSTENRRELQDFITKMVDASTVWLEAFPPMAFGLDGDTSFQVDTSTLPRTPVLTGNITYNASIRQCGNCGTRLTSSNNVVAGATLLDGLPPVDQGLVDEIGGGVCRSCFEARVRYAIDTQVWTTTCIDPMPVTLRTPGSPSLRHTGNMFLMRPVSDRVRCLRCGGTIYSDASLVGSVYDPANRERVIRELVLLGEAPEGSLEQGAALQAPRAIEVYSGAGCTTGCHLCLNPASLYQGADGRLYASIEESPYSAAYGYTTEDPSGRFLPRLLGIEFETGIGSARRSSQLSDELNAACSDGLHVWHIHGDGSLMEGACEIVTPPVGGGVIPLAVSAMYAVARKYHFNIENIRAGMHMHTDISDFFEVILPLRREFQGLRDEGRVASDHPKFSLYMSITKAFGEFADYIATVSRAFVSLNRRSNQYCGGGFGVRSWSPRDNFNSDPLFASYHNSEGGRQAVCIHHHPGYARRKKHTYTLENRLWPSTNRPDYVLARAELSQRMVDTLVKAAIASFEAGSPDPIRELVNRFYAIKHATLPQRMSFIDNLAGLFGLSAATVATLREIHKRFWWVSYHAHENGLALNSPEIMALVQKSLGMRTTLTTANPDMLEKAGIAMALGDQASVGLLSNAIRSPDSFAMDTCLRLNNEECISVCVNDFALVGGSVSN